MITFLMPDDVIQSDDEMAESKPENQLPGKVVEVNEFNTVVEVLVPERYERYTFVNAARNRVPKELREVGKTGWVWTHGLLHLFRAEKRK
jgi:hypothetical protein